MGLKGTVTIEVIEELNAIVLKGDAEDIAKVKKLIESITEQAGTNQPSIEIVRLENSNAVRMQAQVEQAYEQMFEPSLGPINLTPLSQPERLMVIGQPEAIEGVKTLISQLDQADETVDPTGNTKTYKLKYMSSFDAKIRIDEFFQAPDLNVEETPPIEPVSVVSDYRTNSIIVKGSKSSFLVVDRLIAEWDVAESAAMNEVRVIKLKNAVATDLQAALQDAINGQLDGAGQGFSPQTTFGGQNNLQTQFNAQAQAHLRSAMLQLMTLDGNGKLVKSGILYDVRITAEANSNSLIVTGPSESMDLIAELVRRLDTIPDAETLIKVFTIQNGDAQTLLDMFNALFGTQNQTQNFGQTANLSGLPLQNASATDGASLVDLRFSLEPRTNSIIASGTAGDLQVVEDLLLRLDEDVSSRMRTSIYRLSNTPADEIAEAINNWLDTRRDLNDIDPVAANSPTEQVRREVIVEPEIISNSLIVTATPEYFGEIERIIRSLDRRPPMVKVKILIAEVELNDFEEFGVEFGIQDSLLFDRGLGAIGFPFNQAGIGNNSDALALGTRELLAGQGLSNFGTGRTNSELGYGGLVLSAGNESINVLIRALKDKGRLRVLGSPHITTVDNLQASVTVGAEVPRIIGVQQTNFGTQNNIDFVPVGVILQVTPRVSPDGMIIMAVDAIKSSVGAEEQGIPIFITDNGDVIRSPQIPTTEASTTLMARSGQSIAFTGLITTEKNQTRRTVPILGDLPVVGPLFGYESESCRRTELLIVMTPYLIDSDDKVDMVNQAEMDRMNWCLCDVNQVFGGVKTAEDADFDNPAPTIYYPDSDPFGLQPKNNPAYRVLEGGFEPGGTEDLYRQAPGEVIRPEELGIPQNDYHPTGYPQNSNPAPAVQSSEKRDSSKPIATFVPSNNK